ncbi:MAG: PP2C family serine/threonine-protein phosphatase, partial [Pseudomonadota bacterium]
MSAPEVAARSHPGLVRAHNEDTLVCAPDRGLFAVIDGMGGEAAGEVAAALVREHLLAWEPDATTLREALHEANEAILARVAAEPGLRGMGCVVTAVRVEGRGLQVAHAGDTRAYLARGRGVQQLTRDHTVVAAERERLGLTEAEGKALPGQHRVTRDLGGQHHADASWIDTAQAPFEQDDLLLLCSDGLHDLVADEDLLALLREARTSGRPMDSLADALVDLALARGGSDNVTVVCVRALADAPPAPPVPGSGRLPAWVPPAWVLSLGAAALVGAILGRGCAPTGPAAPSGPPPQEAPAPA